ncbi:MAG: aminoglycoside phosphotransferase family protein [Thermocrispum sp.]
MHAGQLTVSPETVRALVDAQFPRLRGELVRPVVSQGTANAIFRVGQHFAARFPLEPEDPALTRGRLESEAAAARELLGRTRFRTPEPIGLGEPGAGYPLTWSVQTWVPGTVAEGPVDAAFAADLAEFIHGVRSIDPRGRTFRGGDRTGRGGELWVHDEWMQTCLRNSEGLLDVGRLRPMWTAMRALPRGPEADLMTHGDLIPGNLLVSGGRLSGVIDVGWLGPADPAVDLVVAWHLLDPWPHQVLRDALGCGPQEWARGRAWAFQQAMGLVWYYVDSNPGMSLLGRRTLERIMAEPG